MFELIDFLIVRPIANILFIIYGLVGDFGLAIILFTALVKICMWPLVKRQLHQTRLMRRIQPQLAEIKKNCNGNRQLESLQMMDLYKRNNIKPFRSFLTLLIQLPIFIALYTAVRVMVLPTPTDNLALRAYPPVGQIERISEVVAQQTSYLDQQAQYTASQESGDEQSLSAPTYDFHPKLFGLVDLDVRPGLGSLSAAVCLLFALASALTQYWVSRQQLPSSKKPKKTFRQLMRETAAGAEPDQAELSAAMSGQMSKMMPIMMLIIMLNLPGALVFYYLISNLFTVAQQRLILNRSEQEMEISADRRLIRELKNVQEAEIVPTQPSAASPARESRRPKTRSRAASGSGAHITRISAGHHKTRKK